MEAEYPPRLRGSVQEQLDQLWDYLYRLAERQDAARESGKPGRETD